MLTNQFAEKRNCEHYALMCVFEFFSGVLSAIPKIGHLFLSIFENRKILSDKKKHSTALKSEGMNI